MKIRPIIIPFFLMNRGCPHRCIFCNESITVGTSNELLTEDHFRKTLEAYVNGRIRHRVNSERRNQVLTKHMRDISDEGMPSTSRPVQIAFYGGNFTGLAHDEQIALLNMAKPWLDKGIVESIRISTRPDYIKAPILDLLKNYRVDTVELGAQSLDDNVLDASGRGHSVAHVAHAVSLLRKSGLKAGIHLMAGLPGDTTERFFATIDRAIALHPHMVRIHPTIVLKDTPLEEYFTKGEYTPLSLSQAVALCKEAVARFDAAHIPVIRVGLQMTPAMGKSGAIVAGPYHPSFRSLLATSEEPFR
jgi:histone acetyltransferase (RNA polymerase elongator complex component)